MGEYAELQATIDKLDVRVSKAGNPMVCVTFKANQSGNKYNGYYALSKSFAADKFIQLIINACGKNPYHVDASAFQEIVKFSELLVGKEVTISVESNGDWQPIVTGTQPPLVKKAEPVLKSLVPNEPIYLSEKAIEHWQNIVKLTGVDSVIKAIESFGKLESDRLTLKNGSGIFLGRSAGKRAAKKKEDACQKKQASESDHSA